MVCVIKKRHFKSEFNGIYYSSISYVFCCFAELINRESYRVVSFIFGIWMDEPVMFMFIAVVLVLHTERQ